MRKDVRIAVAVAFFRGLPSALIVTRSDTNVVKPDFARVILEKQCDINGGNLLRRVHNVLHKLPVVRACAERNEMAIRPLVTVFVLQPHVHVQGVRVAALTINVGSLGPSRYVEGSGPFGSISKCQAKERLAVCDGLSVSSGVIEEVDLLISCFLGVVVQEGNAHRFRPSVCHVVIDAHIACIRELAPHATTKAGILVVGVFKRRVPKNVFIQFLKRNLPEPRLHKMRALAIGVGVKSRNVFRACIARVKQERDINRIDVVGVCGSNRHASPVPGINVDVTFLVDILGKCGEKAVLRTDTTLRCEGLRGGGGSAGVLHGACIHGQRAGIEYVDINGVSMETTIRNLNRRWIVHLLVVVQHHRFSTQVEATPEVFRHVSKGPRGARLMRVVRKHHQHPLFVGCVGGVVAPRVPAFVVRPAALRQQRGPSKGGVCIALHHHHAEVGIGGLVLGWGHGSVGDQHIDATRIAVRLVRVSVGEHETDRAPIVARETLTVTDVIWDELPR
mmetsp:Transcript_37495/g.94206  ORF Transcript_37495/g.94206 Transcript_37495/m.94206 type:complete len:504 (-) Transcript_37495:7153-8664(-)